jgi:hypothetical protein
MALDILNQTLLIDETFGIDANSDDTATTNALITYMTGLTGGTAGNMGTEVAIQTDFVVGCKRWRDHYGFETRHQHGRGLFINDRYLQRSL